MTFDLALNLTIAVMNFDDLAISVCGQVWFITVLRKSGNIGHFDPKIFIF